MLGSVMADDCHVLCNVSLVEHSSLDLSSPHKEPKSGRSGPTPIIIIAVENAAFLDMIFFKVQ